MDLVVNLYEIKIESIQFGIGLGFLFSFGLSNPNPLGKMEMSNLIIFPL